MAITIDWGNRIISVPKDYLTLVSGSVYQLDVNAFRLDLKNIEDTEEGMAFPDTHRHNTETTLGGVTYARFVEFINDYTITFEDGQYAINIYGANNNISDVTNVNQVSIRTANSAGLTSFPAETIFNSTIEDNTTFAELIRLFTSILAGKSLVTELGGGSRTVAYRDLDDTKDRMTATIDATGRTEVTYDLDED